MQTGTDIERKSGKQLSRCELLQLGIVMFALNMFYLVFAIATA